jgi:Domain of unknown function (DUF5666)
MNHQAASASCARRSGLERAAWAALPIVTLSLVLFAGPAGAQTGGNTPPPFTSGMLSALTGSTLTVQARNGNNTTVVVNGSTRYTQNTSASASDVAKGDCVRIVGTGSASSGIQASTVAITQPTSKGCVRNPNGGNGRGAGTGRFGNRFPGGGAPITAPGGGPVTLPNGGTVPSNLAAAFGTVSSVSGSQLSVKSLAPSSNNKKSKPKTRTVTVTLNGSTTFTQTVSAAVSDLAVGKCVTANGTVDSVGTITANRVTISQPVNGACGGGFGGFGRLGGGGGGGGG